MKTISKKIILLGHFGVGKTSLVQQFVHSQFSEKYLTTIGVKIDKKVVQVGDRQLNMLIWDIAGSDNQKHTPKSYLLGSAGAIFVTDLTRPSTFQDLGVELEKIRSMVTGVPIKVVANKMDLFSPEALADRLAEYPSQPDFVTSAKMGKKVEELFFDLAESILNDLRAI